MFGNGNESADILIIGGVLGESEISEGKPIAGRSERLLNNILEKANISKDNIYFHNVICCRPPHNNINSPDAKIALRKCPTFHLINAIIKMRPKVIITLGNTAHKYFFNSEGILKKRGIVKFWNDYYVIPTLHPDYLLSGNSHLINDVVNDFILALSLVNKEENKVKSIIINSVEELSDLKKKLTQSGRFSFDIETTGLNSYRGDLTLGIAFSCNENEGYYLPLREKPIFGEDYDFINQDYIPIVKSLLEDEHLKKTLHNSSFDVEFLKVDFDINVKGIVADTMLLSHLLDENTPNDLDFLTNSNYKDLLGYKRESESKLKTLKSKSFAKLPFSILAKRACIDAVATYRLTNKFISKIKEDKKLYEYYIQIQLPLIPTLINIQLRGFGVNFNYSKEVKTLYEFALDNISNKIYKEVGYKFNINSDNDIRELLYVKLKLPILKYTSKSEDASVDEKTLSELYDKHKNIVLKYILAHNKVAKILNTYIIGMLPKAVDGRLHSKLNINGTRTGRLCVRKGTLIEIVRDVSKYPKGVPIEEVKKGDTAYTYDSNRNLCLKRVEWAGKTGTKKLIRIHWQGHGRNSYGYLDVTPEHKIKMYDGTYKEANSLQKGDRTLSLSRGTTNYGYSRLYICKNIMTFDHRFICSNFGSIEGKHIHHLNKNKLDNRLDNLVIASPSFHTHYESSKMSEETKQRIGNTLLRLYKEGKMPKPKPKGDSAFNWLGLEKEWMEQVLWESGGRPTEFRDKYGIDYETAQKYMKMHNINWEDYAVLFTKDRKEITRELIEKSRKLLKEKGQVSAMKFMGMNFYKFKRLQEEFNFEPINHRILKIEEINEYDEVYDIEVEDTHNFIANEVCVHNSSSGPNQQNVAKNKHIKRIICPKEGYSYLYCDLAQCEIRIFSYLSNDEELMKACITKGQDIYLTMASIMYKKDINTLTKDSPERQSAKTIVLGTLYGLGIYKMANEIKRPVKEAKQIQTLFFKAFPNAKRFVNETIKTVRRTGQVQNVYGRIRRLPEIYSRDDDAKSEAERQAVNFLVQSVAADFVKYSLMRIEKEILERNIDGGIVITVHDSIICEIKDEQIKEFAPVFCKCMTDPVLGVNAPMEVDLMVGKNWWDLKKYDL